MSVRGGRSTGLRVLIVGINYRPERTAVGPYTAGLAESLASRGDVVTVITGLPHYPEWRIARGTPRTLIGRESINGIDVVRAAQAKLGAQRAGEIVEDCLAQVASGLVAKGVKRLVVAGGETSGAVVKALGVRGLRIGPQIDPGVPWTQSVGEPRLALALKSGNFGAVDFFGKALDMQS